VSTDLETVPPALVALERLVSPYGLISHTASLPVGEGEPRFAVELAHIGIPSRALPNLATWHHDQDLGNSDGAGTGLTTARARALARAEALERYSTCSWDEDAFIVSSEADLTEEHVSPSRWPRCSSTELGAAGAQLREYDAASPLRWVRGWSVTRGRPVLVPAIAVHLHMPQQYEAEKFTRGITTGAAVHSDLRSAVLGGLTEVVERDAIALTWLQRLALPPLVVRHEDLRPEVLAHVELGSSTDLDVRLFDATTDLGVPVVYAVQLSEHDPDLGQVVAATCDVDPQVALAKVHRELASLRVALRGFLATGRVREGDEAQVSVVGGAVLNGVRSRRPLFDFLLGSATPPTSLADLPVVPDDEDPLDAVVARLARRGAEVVAVDVTTDEARQVGVHAVKVLVPEAVPVSFVHGERYLATPRLYDAPAAMGHPVSDEGGINPERQPFA